MKSSRSRLLVVVRMVTFWRIYWPKAYWALGIWRIFMWNSICVWILNTISWLFGIWRPILTHVISRSFRIVHFFVLYESLGWIMFCFYLEINLHFSWNYQVYLILVVKSMLTLTDQEIERNRSREIGISEVRFRENRKFCKDSISLYI